MLVIPRIQDQLHHVYNAVITGIHDVFPPDKNDDEDAISHKKVLKKEGAWAVVKNVLVFGFDGNPGYAIWLTEDLCTNISEKFKKWIREGEHRKKGIPFEDFRNYFAKLRNDFCYIPAGKGLLSSYNQVLGKEPQNILLNQNNPPLLDIQDCLHLLKTLAKFTTPCNELVTG